LVHREEGARTARSSMIDRASSDRSASDGLAPRVTALVAGPHDRVRVELDGSPWRTLPAAVVAGARLAVGTEVDRARARSLRRELRRVEALAIATAALARRDHSAAGLAAKLERRRVAPAERERALTTLARAGYVDDERFATTRAGVLAERGYGDVAIRFDLAQHGLADGTVAVALAALAPECDRAAAVVAAAGRDARTARRLAARGFAPETIEALFS
jgi:regulatory protein